MVKPMTEEEKKLADIRSNDIAEAILNANADIQYTDIKGKDYAEVKERVKAFRRVFPEGSISTKIITIDDDHCVVKASVFNENGSLLAEGHAQEMRASTRFKDKILEVTETSAIGRALGVLGFGIKGGMETADTMKRVTDRDETKDKMLICHRCGRVIRDSYDKDGVAYSAEKISRMTTKVYGDPYCFPCVGELQRLKPEANI